MQLKNIHPFKLNSGAQFMMHLTLGNQVQVLAGKVRVIGPCLWLAGTLTRPEAQLITGQSWIANESGWVSLVAQSTACSETAELRITSATDETDQPGTGLRTWAGLFLATLTRNGRKQFPKNGRA